MWYHSRSVLPQSHEIYHTPSKFKKKKSSVATISVFFFSFFPCKTSTWDYSLAWTVKALVSGGQPGELIKVTAIRTGRLQECMGSRNRPQAYWGQSNLSRNGAVLNSSVYYLSHTEFARVSSHLMWSIKIMLYLTAVVRSLTETLKTKPEKKPAGSSQNLCGRSRLLVIREFSTVVSWYHFS